MADADPKAASAAPRAPGLSFALGDSGARLSMPHSGLPLELRWRRDPDAHVLLDARALLLRRLSLNLIFMEGAIAIRSGAASDVDVERADQYLREQEKAQAAVWQACHTVVSLAFEIPKHVDLLAALPTLSDALIKVATDALERLGLTAEEEANLRLGVLDAFGVRQGPDGTIPTCSCAALHGYGPCPAWDPFAWLPKPRRLWNDWRAIRLGQKVPLELAHLVGFPLIERVSAELTAVGRRAPGAGGPKPARAESDTEPAQEEA